MKRGRKAGDDETKSRDAWPSSRQRQKKQAKPDDEYSSFEDTRADPLIFEMTTGAVPKPLQRIYLQFLHYGDVVCKSFSILTRSNFLDNGHLACAPFLVQLTS
ncbi:unnamed protein product [Amoebophrya sp. A25]|nr:unnamed protein product [Amoebophrya sp. A25]|eukprot:GSA25T00012276001.1